jgi:hypothetical protein
MNPTQRVRLEGSQNLRDCPVLPEASQEMNMVSDAVSEVTKATRAANGATQVFPQPRTQLVLKPGFPVFCGKHKVIEKAGIGLGHEEPPLRFRHPCGVFGRVVAIVPQGCSAAPERRSFTLGYTPPPLPGLYASYLVSNRQRK